VTARTKPDDWMPLHIRHYLGDTLGLSRDEHGAYLLLLMAYWMRGGPLEDDDRELAQIVKANSHEWHRLRPVLTRFFVIENGKWSQKRADRELNVARNKIESKSRAGKLGAAAKWQTHDSANDKKMADASLRHGQNGCQTNAPLTTNLDQSSLRSEDISRPKSKKVAKEPEGFAAFYAAFPLHKARAAASKAFSKALLLASAAELIDGAKRYAAERSNEDPKFTAHAATWLAHGRWLDEARPQREAKILSVVEVPDVTH